MSRLPIKAIPMVLAIPAFLLAVPAGAQTQTPSPAPSQKCVAPLPPPDGQNAPSTPQGGGLSGKLQDCKGELKAPGVGDNGMVEPAPDTGNSRVIRPGDLPPNSNPSNGSGG